MQTRAALLYGVEDMRIEEITLPELKEGELLVKVGTALTCGTDLKAFLRGGHKAMSPPPARAGHEWAGTVAAVGPGVTGFKEGMRVSGGNSAPCQHCFYCRRGYHSLCEDIIYNWGTYSEHIIVPRRIVEQNVHPLPDHVSFAEAAFVEPLACVVHGIERVDVHLGDTVAVTGVGSIGLMFIILAKLKGARVIASGRFAPRLELAKAFGADEVIDIDAVDDQVQAVRALTEEGRGADLVIEAVGKPPAWEKSIAMARKAGTVVLFGGCPAGTSISVDTTELHYSELTLKGIYHHTPRYVKMAFDLIVQGAVDPKKFIKGTMPLSRLEEALRLVKKGEGLKYAIVPEE
jgi:L-iditol 2-dehydrogenase